MIKYRSMTIALLIFVLFGYLQAADINDLRSTFAHPPDDSRIMMRWWWFGPAVTKAEIERELRVMKEGGIGGVEVQPVYPLLPDDPKNGIKNIPYLSDEFLEMLRFTAAKCKELGMRFDLTLGSGWSFGGAKTPITEAAGQLRVERVKVSGDRVPLPYMIPAEKLLAIFLAPSNAKAVSANDLKELADIHDGNVFLPASAAPDSEVLFFISGKSGMQVKRPAAGAEGYVLNHLDQPSVEDYLKTTGDRLFQAFDRSSIPYSVFCDSLEVYNQDWTDDFLAEFQKRRGYDLKPYLPALVMDIGPKTADIRYDWGRTITELFNDRFMIPMQAWAKRNGTRFRIQGYGLPPAAISSNKWTDISDGEGAQWKVVRAARWASSANHIYGRNITSSETWTWLHSPVFRATPLDLKAEADIHFLQGINQLIGHGWAYTPPQIEYPGWRFYAAGIYDEKNPWWVVMPDLAAYLQRMSWLMRQGEPVNDVALYLPNADAYAHFTPGKVHLIDAERELVGDKIMPAIFEAGYNLDFFDDQMLTTDTKRLLERHSVVALPGIERMQLESLKRIESYVRAGGIVVATRRLPAIAPGVKVTDAERDEFARIVRDLFGGVNPKVQFVEKDEEIGATLRSLTQPDVSISPSAKDFGFVHRRTEDADIYFVANTSNQKRSVQITFRSASSSKAETWDAINGSWSMPLVKSDGIIDCNFEPYQSRLIVFSKSLSTRVAVLDHSDPPTTIDLSSDWRVSFASQDPSEKPAPAITFDKLHSWTDERGMRSFSGVASYEKSIEVPGGFASAILNFGEGKPLDVQISRNGMQTWFEPPIREAAIIYVNGKRVGSLWSPPYTIEIAPFLKPGRNEIRVQVGNTALNYMSGRKLPDYKLLNLRYGERFQAQDMDKIEPLPSGLIGKVSIEFRK
jgi:hypothetical protein